ncbi:glycoside hydrolase family 105 protein [Paenibacillus sp. NPDC058174]|uniref:glycoside hydrolase family 88/105 protein n=1 Tax=Paenibacillus sp. NPDC058174 TaxID=3346366 RepID=UPI0036DBB7BE
MNKMSRTDVEEAAHRVYRFMMHSKPEEWGGHAWTDWAMNIDKWDWNPGVAIIAAVEYGRATGDSSVLQEVEDWVRRNRGQSEEVRVINSMAPYAIFPQLYQMTGDAYYLEKAVEIAEWMVEQAPRTSEGAFEHTVTENAQFSEQIWADTVFMAVLFLARTARLTGSRKLAEEALLQALLHLGALQDEATGLLFHGWDGSAGHWMSAARWNRANGWNAAGIPMILEEAEPLCRDSDLLHELKHRYSRLIEALAACQLPGGMWPTVLDRPGFYEETSGSAAIALGLYKAVRMGLASEQLLPRADRALAAIVPMVAATGAVSGVSGGTPVLESEEAYNEVPIFPTLYGQGLVLLLLSEVIEQR